MLPAKKSFNLPSTVTFLFSKCGEDVVAHALDFDLVAVADTEGEAKRKIRLAVQTYVEYGLSKNWVDEIIFPAPDRYWDGLQNSTIALMEPIEVANLSFRTFLARPRHEKNAGRGVAVPA